MMPITPKMAEIERGLMGIPPAENDEKFQMGSGGQRPQSIGEGKNG
jgi:hypothetical protein